MASGLRRLALELVLSALFLEDVSLGILTFLISSLGFPDGIIVDTFLENDHDLGLSLIRDLFSSALVLVSALAFPFLWDRQP